jgi:hypothetical protein
MLENFSGSEYLPESSDNELNSENEITRVMQLSRDEQQKKIFKSEKRGRI